MSTYYEIIEGDHYRPVSRFDDYEEAATEANRLNSLYNRDYYVTKVADGKRLFPRSRFRDGQERYNPLRYRG